MKAVNVSRGARCAVGASEGLCWSGGVLLGCSSCLFVLLYYYEDFIIDSVESKCEASGLMWWAWISECHVCINFPCLYDNKWTIG